jgi:hypothetical protein
MARGLAKVQSKEKAMKKAAKVKPKHDEKAAREQQLKVICAVCRVRTHACDSVMV